MRYAPRPLRSSLISWTLGRNAVALGLAALLGSLAAYALGVLAGLDPADLYAYAFLSMLGGNLATLVVTAWPTASGAGRFGPILIALLVAPLVVMAAAFTELPARLLHLENIVPAYAAVAAGLPACAVLLGGVAMRRVGRTVS
jgi:hypothetical protein